MVIKALKSFAGVVNMRRNEQKEVDDEAATKLIEGGFAEAVTLKVESDEKPKTEKSKRPAKSKGGEA